MPFHKESNDEYVVPQDAENPQFTFKNALGLMQYCEQNSREANNIYWQNIKEAEPRHAMVFYTVDGACILGLSVDDEKLEIDYLEKLKKFSSSSFGYITYESPPEDPKEEFIAVVKVLEKM